MPRVPEGSYEQHRNDIERIEKAEGIKERHATTAKEKGDLTSHPELWDDASAEYQAWAKKEVSKSMRKSDFDRASKLTGGLKKHQETNERLKDKAPITSEAFLENDAFPLDKRSRKELLEMITEEDWKRFQEKAQEKINNAPLAWTTFDYIETLQALVSLKVLDPEKFESDFMQNIPEDSWDKIAKHSFLPNRYYTMPQSRSLLKKINPSFFSEKRFDEKPEIIEGIIKGLKTTYYNNGKYLFFEYAGEIKDIVSDEDLNKDTEVSTFLHTEWDNITKSLDSLRGNEEGFRALAAAQRIKPEGKPDVNVISINEWEAIKSYLSREKSNGYLRGFFENLLHVFWLKVDRDEDKKPIPPHPTPSA